MEEPSVMRRVLDRAPLEWLLDAEWNGFDPTGWPDSTWILHPMSVRRDHPLWRETDLSVERRTALAEQLVGEVGDTLGPEWTRLRWSEYFQRVGVAASDHQWWDPRTFPWWVPEPGPNSLGVLIPEEGDLEEDLGPLLACLAAHSPRGMKTPCYAYWDHVAVFWHHDSFDGKLYEGPLGGVPSLIGPVGGDTLPDTSPTNLWPTDRSWFVYTDPDSSATKVSGSDALVRALRNHPDLETIDWAPGGG